MKCPNCNETLVMSDRQGVEIDYCPKCRGVWLDRGELDKIIEKSQSVFPDKKQDYDDDHKYNSDEYKQKGGQYDQEYYKRKKKRGFLGDFFDFD